MNGTPDKSKNTLNSDVEITGRIKFSEELTFDGKIDGEIQTNGTLHLGDNATIKGQVYAGSVVVRGKINGNITAKERIAIKANTELFGNVRAARLVIEEGATFVGQSDISPNKVVPPGAQPSPPAAGAKNAELAVKSATAKAPAST